VTDAELAQGSAVLEGLQPETRYDISVMCASEPGAYAKYDSVDMNVKTLAQAEILKTVSIKHIKKETSRVSKDFNLKSLDADEHCHVTVDGLPMHAAAGVSFALLEKKGALAKTKCLMKDIKHGSRISLGGLRNKNIYIGRLKYNGAPINDAIGAPITVEKKEVFKALGVGHIDISIRKDLGEGDAAAADEDAASEDESVDENDESGDEE